MKMGVGQTINVHMEYNWKPTIFRPEEVVKVIMDQKYKTRC